MQAEQSTLGPPGPREHLPSTLGTLSTLPGPLCLPGTWLPGRGAPAHPQGRSSSLSEWLGEAVG